ncbi:MAG TPA: RHS repeat-associated core domain-containing protein [Terriglobia bacterium]|nr:RHS repeat-associated core domain-containing protein [Terriglobia bacterium]
MLRLCAQTLASLLFIACGTVALQAQYLLEVGSPTWATKESVPLGFINLANGNLHIEIPIAEVPQRGGRPLIAKMVYDSRIWKIVDTGASLSWQPTNAGGTPGTPLDPPGWKFLTTTNAVLTMDTILHQCSVGETTYYWTQYQNYRFLDSSGTWRRFPLYEETSVPCHAAGTGTAAGPSLDATGYWMNGTQEVIAPDGTKEYYRGAPGSIDRWKDANGNYMQQGANGMPIDTLARMPLQKSVIGNNEIDYTVLTSQGSSVYKLYFDALITVSTSFGVPGVTEYSGGWYTLRKIELPDGSSYQFAYESPNGHGLLRAITLPTGETVTFTHANFTDAQGNTNRWVNSRTMGGGTQSFLPAVCGSNCNQMTVARPNGDETVYTFSLNNGAWNTLIRAYSGPAASGALAATVQYDYDTTLADPVFGGSAFVRRLRTTTTLPGPSGDMVKKTEGEYDTFTYSYRGTNYTGSRGNLLTMREHGYGEGSPGALLRQTVLEYLHDVDASYAAKNIVRRLRKVQTKDAGGTTVAEAITLFDSTPLTSVTGVTQHDDVNFGAGYLLRGNPTVIQRWTGTSYLATTYTYDTTGQVVAVADPKGNVTQISYANNFYLDNGANPPAPYSPAPPPTNAFATQVISPLSGSRSYGYYYGSGKRAFSKDPNNVTTYYHFQDPLDRPTRKDLPGGAWVQNQFPSATGIVHTATVAGGNFQDQHAKDPLGRFASGSVNDPEGTTYGESLYDSSGRLLTVTSPYRSVSDPTYGSNSFQYDSLDRLTRLTLPDGNYTEAFYGAAVGAAGGRTTQICPPDVYGMGYPTLFKDEAGKLRQSWQDALGRLIEVDEPDATGALTLETCSKYDVLGNLIQVDQGNQTRLAVYDGLSRLVSETTPEGGTETFHYTTAGGALCAGDARAVCRATDARGVTTTYTYDAENRLTGKSYSNGDAPVAYYYDQTSYNGLTITNGKGRRTGMSDGSGQTAWSYNAGGAVLAERRTIAGVTKTISYTYFADGSLNRIYYPSGLVVGHTYNTAKRLTQVSCLSFHCSGTMFGGAASYSPFGALASLTLAVSGSLPNGISSTFTYNNRFQPVNIKATRNNGTVTLLDLTYNFLQAGGKNNGTVTSITNNLSAGRSQSFTYDELNRLKTAQSQANSGADCWGQSFSYDRYGNLQSITVTKCSAPTLNLSVDTKNQITNTGFSYDLSGNLTADGFSTYTWTAEDQLAATSGVSYLYDGDHRRVKKSNGTLYWYNPQGELLAESDLSGNLRSEYIYFNGRRIARRDVPSGNTYYYLTDHLGSARVVTNSSGVVVEESDYYPFGTERVITDTMNNSLKFAGMERDAESALDHTLYRKYSASLARWLSPDVQRGEPRNPQTLNRYPYVLNNPGMLTDPLGDSPRDDPYLLGCFPDPFFEQFTDMGCGWDPEEDPCPPGFEPIYGERSPFYGGHAIETFQSLLEYFGLRLTPYAPGVLQYELGPNGINISMSEADFRMLQSFNPVLTEAIPYIIAGGRVLIQLLRMATVALLANLLDSLMITCHHNGGNIVEENPRTRTCTYDCDDGSTFHLTGVPITEPCPNPLIRIRSIFVSQ